MTDIWNTDEAVKADTSKTRTAGGGGLTIQFVKIKRGSARPQPSEQQHSSSRNQALTVYADYYLINGLALS